MPLRSPRLTKSLTDLPLASFATGASGLLAAFVLGLIRLGRAVLVGTALARSRRRGRGACSIRSSGLSHSPIEVFTSRSIRPISSRWAGVTKVIARPVRPTRPVRPIRCT